MQRSFTLPSFEALLCCAALASLHCAPSSPPAATARTETRTLDPISRFLPLKNDTVYSFDTVAESTGEHGILILQVTRPGANRVDLKIGSKIQRLEVDRDGARLISGGYLLKAPLTRGASFQGASGPVHIVDTDKTIQVEAGTFTGCLETEEDAADPDASKRVSTVFCPDVGIVSLIAEAHDEDGPIRETATLKSFGERVDLGVPNSP